MKKNIIRFVFFVIFFSLIFSGCKDSWKYEFINEFMKNPENIIYYSNENKITLSTSVLDLIKDPYFFGKLINLIKSSEFLEYTITVDEKWYVYDNILERKYKTLKHRIQISSKTKSNCIIFYFSVGDDINKVNAIILANDKKSDDEEDGWQQRCE